MLSVSFLIAVISPPSYLYKVFESLYRIIFYSILCSILLSPLPPSFLDTYSLSTPSLGCNAVCIVISFLVLWSICLSSSLVHLKKGLEYLTRGTAQVFIPLIFFSARHFCLEDLFFSSPGIFSLNFFLSFPLVRWCQPPRCPSICRFFLIIIIIIIPFRVFPHQRSLLLFALFSFRFFLSVFSWGGAFES